MKDENFTLEVSGKKISVRHNFSGWKPFSEQAPQALEDLKEIIKEDLQNNITKGCIPYNNFECLIEWDVV